MKDRIMKQAYDRGYDDDVKARETGKPATNPYQPTRGFGRRWYWDMGRDDSSKGRPRKISQTEANERDRRRLTELEEIVRVVANYGSDIYLRGETVVCPFCSMLEELTPGTRLHDAGCIVPKARDLVRVTEAVSA